MMDGAKYEDQKWIFPPEINEERAAHTDIFIQLK